MIPALIRREDVERRGYEGDDVIERARSAAGIDDAAFTTLDVGESARL